MRIAQSLNQNVKLDPLAITHSNAQDILSRCGFKIERLIEEVPDMSTP